MSIEIVKKIRLETGLGLLEIKKALEVSGGDEGKAVRWLQENAKAKVEKPADPAAQGCIGVYRHHSGTVAALVYLACQTDFTARNDEFAKLAGDIAMHVVASRPRWVSQLEAVAEVASERAIQLARAKSENVPEARIQQVVEGRVRCFVRENVLLDQPFVRDQTVTVGELVQRLSAKTGEAIVVRSMSRLEVGRADGPTTVSMILPERKPDGEMC